jgi:hypothetical protein
MAKTPDIVAEIAQTVRRRQPSRWYQRAGAEHGETLSAIAAAYKAGKFGTAVKPAADAISAVLKSRGIADVGFNGVIQWLRSL